jgi:hypothetical protein
VNDLAFYTDGTFLRADLAADQAQDSGLATARTAHDSHYLPAREVHMEAGQDRPLPIAEV